MPNRSKASIATDKTYLQHRAVKRETAHGEDLADLDDNEAKKEQLHFPRQYYLSAMSMHSTAPV